MVSTVINHKETNRNTDCPCGSKNDYVTCCEPYLHHKKKPETPEALMRSRYTAYSLADIPYIQKTMRGKALLDFDEVDAKRWATHVNWIKLTVLDAGLDALNEGHVEFIASFMDGHSLKSIHEKSDFIQEAGRWYYVDGIQFPTTTTTISRNSVCPCGSQRKYKHCHGKS